MSDRRDIHLTKGKKGQQRYCVGEQLLINCAYNAVFMGLSTRGSALCFFPSSRVLWELWGSLYEEVGFYVVFTVEDQMKLLL